MSFHSNTGGLRGCRTFGHSGDSDDEFVDPRSFHRLRRDFSDFDRHFSPSVRKSGEEILRDLKAQLRRDGDMFFNNSPPDWGFGPQSTMFSKAEEGEDGRRGAFRVPGWGGDDSVSQLAARMSQTPPLASVGRRGGPWRERRGSGGSAMSATSEDSCDAPDRGSQGSAGSDPVGHEIPIRLEAPAPPKPQEVQPQEVDDTVGPLGSQGRCPVRTTSAVDASDHSNDSARNSRCASAPPEVAQVPDAPPVFVSKISITPQQPQGSQGSPVPQGSSSPPGVSQGSTSPLPAKFNTVPRPFVAAGKQQQDAQQQPQQQQWQQQQPPQQQQQWQQNYPQQDSQWQFQEQPFSQFPQHQQHYPQQQQYQQQPYSQQQYPSEPAQRGQRPSVVRNIPIFVEGRDDPAEDPRSSPQRPPRQSQQHFQQPQPQPQQQPQPSQQQFHQPQPSQQQFHQPQPSQQQFHQPQPAQQQFHQPQQPQFQPQQKSHIRTQQPTAPPTQPIPQPVPMPMPQPHEPSPAQPPQEGAPEQQQSPQQPQQNDIDPRLVQIAAVAGSVAEYSERVEKFTGGRKSKEFLYLDEMLTRALLQLDNVDPDGRQDVRQARRAVIKEINSSIGALEAKANEGDKLEKEVEHPSAELMETQANEQAVKNTESADNLTSQGKTEPDSTVMQKDSNMEVQQAKSGDADSQEEEQTVGTAETLTAEQSQPSADNNS